MPSPNPGLGISRARRGVGLSGLHCDPWYLPPHLALVIASFGSVPLTLGNGAQQLKPEIDAAFIRVQNTGNDRLLKKRLLH